MNLHRLAIAAALVAFSAPAWATSTINTAQPAQGQSYNAAPIRSNFQAAANDISALQAMNAGATPPSAPVNGMLWLDTPQNQSLQTLNIYDDRLSKWIPIATLDSQNGLWITNVGGGLPVSLLADNTTDLGSVPNAVITVTGPGPIYSFGSTAPAGIIKVIQFDGATQIVNNSVSMILPGGADINAIAGDMAFAVALGSGNWKIMFFQSAACAVVAGCTGRTSLTAHTVLVGEGTSPIGMVGPGASGIPLLGAGASADPVFGPLNLSGSAVTGTLGVGNGGTGIAAITAHDLMVGNDTSPVTLLAPGTAGFPLVSLGPTLDPQYQLLSVPGGGTGVGTITAHGVMLGEGVSSIAVAAPGTAGYPLLSTGGSSDPAFGQLDLGGAGVTGSLPLTSIAAIPSNTVLGNVTGGSAPPAALTKTQATTLCDIFTAALSGCVPASGGGSTTFLRADGVFAAPTTTGGVPTAVRVFTANATYTPTPGTTAVEVITQGAGGGGGTGIDGGAGTVGIGISGGSGGYAIKYLTSGFSGQAVTVGAAGAGGAGGAGSPGGTSSFGAIVTCTGGAGGAAPAAVNSFPTNSSTAAGGICAGGDINIPGQYSFASLYLSATAGLAGAAGGSPLGSSGLAYGVTAPGVAGNGYGAGGTAGVTFAGGNQAGGAGAPGVVYVYEFGG